VPLIEPRVFAPPFDAGAGTVAFILFAGSESDFTFASVPPPRAFAPFVFTTVFSCALTVRGCDRARGDCDQRQHQETDIRRRAPDRR